jgi:hypothetical protein
VIQLGMFNTDEEVRETSPAMFCPEGWLTTDWAVLRYVVQPRQGAISAPKRCLTPGVGCACRSCSSFDH